MTVDGNLGSEAIVDGNFGSEAMMWVGRHLAGKAATVAN